MELIGKIFGLGIVIIIADKILAEAGRKDIAFGVTLAGMILVLGIIVTKINELFKAVTTMFGF